MLRVFFFFATFGEALSQTAQAFIPGQLARERALKAAKAPASLTSDTVDAANPVKEHTVIDPRRSPARAMMRCGVFEVSIYRSLLLASGTVRRSLSRMFFARPCLEVFHAHGLGSGVRSAFTFHHMRQPAYWPEQRALTRIKFLFFFQRW